MKINVKTLKGAQFSIEVNPEDTVADVKQNIEAVQGAGVYPATQQLLVHQGKILKDDTTLDKNNVSENNVMVVMLSKTKSTSTGGESSSTTTSLAAPPSNPPPVVTPPPSRAPAPNMEEETIQQLLDMGGGIWNRDIVVRALSAASNNPTLAAEFLYSGVPSVPPQVAAAPPPATIAPPQPTISSSGCNANPLDLFPHGLPNTNNVDNDTGASAGAGAGTGVLDFLRNNQQFEVMRALVQVQPEILEPLLQQLESSNPDIVRLIRDNQDEFNRLLGEPINVNALQALQAQIGQPHTVAVTQEENEAIERLQAMGFDRNNVIEVFLACNKNEELAANFLLDHMHDN